MTNQGETFWQFLWRHMKHPIKALGGSPLAQSAAATIINIFLLVIAVLGQFWVIASAVLLTAQTYNTWLVHQGRMNRPTALAVGVGLVSINFSALTLAPLGQFWVFGSTALAVWQFVSLVRVCRSAHPPSALESIAS